ncbi:DUF1207 domain-containing protein [Novipirellula artificiosorum]|uniref:DUF1207 domain-containing protein n=1 Tax=Novipirellula artificiosorum TaxID=2528016 RepID=A0A5C6DC34_9BACT|nr:DUF1207 domain-containing protein [Novipirellula artificiosorum]TWU33414.1 hypothetical protein Poly41_51680 [Novipirellula artificiosorum]
MGSWLGSGFSARAADDAPLQMPTIGSQDGELELLGSGLMTEAETVQMPQPGPAFIDEEGPVPNWALESAEYYEQSSEVVPLYDNTSNRSVQSYFDDTGASLVPNASYPYGEPSCAEPWTWTALPDGLLWHSYLAAPHEPRISTVIFGDTDHGIYWDATLGGRVGLLRYGTGDARGGQGWQWDVEGAAMTRLNIREQEDVESVDFRFGTLITTRQGNWGAKFGYFHISSHVGDEYLIRNPLFERINYVTESLVLGGSLYPNERVRIYGESALAVKRSGGAKPWQFQTGFEYTGIPVSRTSGNPFFAVNLDLREAVDFDPAWTLQTGWQWKGSKSGNQFRTGLQYHNGPTSQFEFFYEDEHYLGGGVWYDY